MSSRPPGQDRFSQMSEQAAIIARKKAEIEAKLKAAADGQGKNETSLPKATSSGPSNTALSKTPKNRWGFKGKRSNTEEVATAHGGQKFPFLAHQNLP